METASPQHQVVVDRLTPAHGQKSNMRKQMDDLLFGSVSYFMKDFIEIAHSVLFPPNRSYSTCPQVAGIVGKFVEYPFDTVKVRLQTQSLSNPKFSGPLDCITKTIKEHGIKDLYRVCILGNSSPLYIGGLF